MAIFFETKWRRHDGRRNCARLDFSSGLCLVRSSLLLLLTLLSTQPHLSGAVTFGCSHEFFKMHGSDCYAYFSSATDYLHANRKCGEYNNGHLASILSIEEFNFILTLAKNQSSSTGALEFWIGLSDKTTEGTFAWEQSGAAPQYQKWSHNQPGTSNTNLLDCVSMREDGWHMYQFGCQPPPGLPYVCKTGVCISADCVHTSAVTAASSSSSTGVIVAVVMVIIILAIIVIALAYTWKYHNDKWELYVCYFCKMKESRENINSLQQENQRLRRQLTQQRHGSQISLTGAGNEVIQGPSDGQGGFLPSLKPMASSPGLPQSPLATGDGTSPPPLRRNTSSSVAPMSSMASRGSLMHMYQRGSVQQGIAGPTSPNPNANRRGSQDSARTYSSFAGSIPSSPRRSYQQLPVFHSTPASQPVTHQPIATHMDMPVQSPKKKVSVIQEADEEEEEADRPGSQASIPGEIEQA